MKPDLYNLLKEEKIYGSTDRDPNAKRDDLHYLGKNYLYVYDLTQTVRPIAIREWSDHYPVMQLSLDGKCPFIEDPTDQNLERKRLKRLRKFEANQAHREALRLATYKMINGISMSVHGFTATSTSTDKVDEEDSTVKEPSEDQDSVNHLTETLLACSQRHLRQWLLDIMGHLMRFSPQWILT